MLLDLIVARIARHANDRHDVVALSLHLEVLVGELERVAESFCGSKLH